MTRNLRPFSKPYCTVPQQIQILKDRGLLVADDAIAEAAIRHLGYYRLSGYAWPYRNTELTTRQHSFPEGTRLEELLQIARYDDQMRQALMTVLGVLEVDFRARFADNLGARFGPFGHVDASNFAIPRRSRSTPSAAALQRRRPTHSKWLSKARDEARRSSEDFCVHYKQNYAGFPDLPVWMAVELLSFGSLSKLFQVLLKPDQQAIARFYKLPVAVFESWLHHLSYVRNLCPHQSRVWDRMWSVEPAPGYGSIWKSNRVPNYKRPYATLLIITFLLREAIPDADETKQWAITVRELLQQYPMPSDGLRRTGLPEDWDEQPLLRST